MTHKLVLLAVHLHGSFGSLKIQSLPLFPKDGNQFAVLYFCSHLSISLYGKLGKRLTSIEIYIFYNTFENNLLKYFLKCDMEIS